MDYNSLEESFQGGESVYDGETNINKSDTKLVFFIALSDDAQQFLKELTQTNVQNSQSIIVNKPIWNDIRNNGNEYELNKFKIIKKRMINIKSNDNGFTFFTKKNINTNIIQKVFITNNDEYIIFSVIKSIVDGKTEDFKIIDKMILSNKYNNISSPKNNITNVKIDGRIIWRNSQNVSQTIMRSKWFRYYQSRFETVCINIIYCIYTCMCVADPKKLTTLVTYIYGYICT